MGTRDNCKGTDRMNLEEKWQLDLRKKEARTGIPERKESGPCVGKRPDSHRNLERRE